MRFTLTYCQTVQCWNVNHKAVQLSSRRDTAAKRSCNITAKRCHNMPKLSMPNTRSFTIEPGFVQTKRLSRLLGISNDEMMKSCQEASSKAFGYEHEVFRLKL